VAAHKGKKKFNSLIDKRKNKEKKWSKKEGGVDANGRKGKPLWHEGRE